MDKKLYEFPGRTVINVLKDNVDLSGIFPKKGDYIYKKDDHSRIWFGVTAHDGFRDDLIFHVGDVKRYYDKNDIDILVPLGSLEDYDPKVGDVFMCFAGDAQGNVLFIYKVENGKMWSSLINDPEKEYENKIWMFKDTIEQQSIGIVDGPYMSSLYARQNKTPECTTNHGRSTCYICGAQTEELNMLTSITNICPKCKR